MSVMLWTMKNVWVQIFQMNKRSYEKIMNNSNLFSSYFLSFNMILYFTYHSGQLQHDQKVIRHTWKSRIVRWCWTPLANKLFVLSHKIKLTQQKSGPTVILEFLIVRLVWVVCNKTSFYFFIYCDHFIARPLND